METLTPLDWRDCFKAPTLSELKGLRNVSLGQVEDKVLTEAEIKEEKKSSKTLKSVVFILKTASITCAVLTLAPVVGSAVCSAFGFTTAKAIAASSIFVGPTYVAGSNGAIAALAPVASGVSGWNALISKVLMIVDYLMDGVIIFSGISWMFGNRTKAIELLLGAGVGYVIVRHHDDIKNFFALL